MSVLFIAVPIALAIALVAVIAFVVQVRNGQYDDLETPAQRMLYDDVEQKIAQNDGREADASMAVAPQFRDTPK